jgi:hypothetical protein
MSNDLIDEYTEAGTAFKSTQRKLLELDDGVSGTLLAPPQVPDLLEDAVRVIVDQGTMGELTSALDEVIRRLLSGAGAKAISTGDFDPLTITKICLTRASVMDLPIADTPDTVLYTDHPLRGLLHREVERFARMVLEVRAINDATIERFNTEREDLSINLTESRTKLDLVASRLARQVLMNKGASILDVMNAEAKAQSWKIFVDALIAECRWLCIGPSASERETALAVVRTFDTSEVTFGAFTANVHITRAYNECIQYLGHAS